MRRWPVELGKGPSVQALKQRRGLAVSSAFLILGPVVVNIGPVAPEAAAACTYSETVDGNANTSSNYTNAVVPNHVLALGLRVLRSRQCFLQLRPDLQEPDRYAICRPVVPA